MEYRMAKEADCKAVYDMICDMEAKSLPWDAFAAIFRRQLENPGHAMIVCEEGGAVMAVLHLRIEEQLHHAGPVAEIMEFVVKDGWRSRGRGAEILDYACRYAEKRGCGQIEVACNQLRRDTHRFYQRQGMQNFHYKFSKGLGGVRFDENVLGR